MKNKTLSIVSRGIPYIKEFKPLAKTIVGCILMQQLDYWFGKMPKGYYKFLSPCPNNNNYKEGDSWEEEINISPDEFRTAFDKFAIRYKSKAEFLMQEDKFQGKFYCSYFDKIKGLTFYFRNDRIVDDAITSICNNVTTDSEDSNTDEGASYGDGGCQSTGMGDVNPDITIQDNTQYSINSTTSQQQTTIDLVQVNLKAVVRFQKSLETIDLSYFAKYKTKSDASWDEQKGKESINAILAEMKEWIDTPKNKKHLSKSPNVETRFAKWVKNSYDHKNLGWVCPTEQSSKGLVNTNFSKTNSNTQELVIQLATSLGYQDTINIDPLELKPILSFANKINTNTIVQVQTIVAFATNQLKYLQTPFSGKPDALRSLLTVLGLEKIKNLEIEELQGTLQSIDKKNADNEEYTKNKLGFICKSGTIFFGIDKYIDEKINLNGQSNFQEKTTDYLSDINFDNYKWD